MSMSPSIPAVGYGGFFWTFIGCMLLYGTVVLSLAELCSMSPTAGGQFEYPLSFCCARLRVSSLLVTFSSRQNTSFSKIRC